MAETETSEHARRFLAEIDEALNASPALASGQGSDLDRLRIEIETHCRSGDIERARNCRKLALKLIQTGAPVPE